MVFVRRRELPLHLQLSRSALSLSVPLLVLVLHFWVSEAKLQSSPIRISGPKRVNHWKYLSKFGYAPGTGTYKVRLQLRSPKKINSEAKVQLEVFQDDDWPQVEALEDVCKRYTLAKTRKDLLINSAGDWGDWVEGTVEQYGRPHIWYFALSDCDDNGGLANYTHRLKFEFKANQEDGSEFSVEMRWMLFANTVFLAGLTAFMWIFSKQVVVFYKSAHSVHPVIIVLTVIVGVQYLAQALHTLHLLLYKGDGSGIKALEVLSEILSMLSQITMTSLLILIALGYTLLQSKLGELDLMIPLCFMIGVIHMMLVGFGKIKDDASYKFHENEGAVGWILMVMRLLLYIWFLWAVQSTAAECGRALRQFLSKFRAGGSIYFLAYPTIFLVTKCFASYLQHSVMTIGLMTLQMGSNIWLATSFLTRGEYFKVSTLSASDLPGGTKVGVVKEE